MPTSADRTGEVGIFSGETARYGKKVAGAMEPGESVVVACRVNHKGNLSGVLGAAAKVASAKLEPGVEHLPPGSLAERVPRTGPVLWVVTTKRMLFFKVNVLKIGQPSVSYQLDDVAAISARKAKVADGKLTLDFRDASRIILNMTSDHETERINQETLALLGPPR